MFYVLFPMAQATEQLNMIGYSDADWCGDKINKRITKCCVNAKRSTYFLVI
jgi:hypothetical protein